MGYKRSMTVENEVKELFAIMAKAAARKAIHSIEVMDDPNDAQVWADTVEGWLDRAGAHATNRRYSQPILKI